MQFYVSILSIFLPDRNLEALWQNLQNAETFEEWEAAGLALDHKYNIDYWYVPGCCLPACYGT